MRCPKCGGSGHVRHDEFGTYWTCWQGCTSQDLIPARDGGWSALMREPALGVGGIVRPKHIQEGE